MAFETVGTGKFVKSNSLTLGQSIEGFVVGKYNSEKYPEKDEIEMVINGEKVILNTHGGLKYFFSNGNKPGYYYRFTRLEDKKTPKGAMSPQFKIEIDRSKKLEASIDQQAVSGTDELQF
jgi:hypothetical protein